MGLWSVKPTLGLRPLGGGRPLFRVYGLWIWFHFDQIRIISDRFCKCSKLIAPTTQDYHGPPLSASCPCCLCPVFRITFSCGVSVRVIICYSSVPGDGLTGGPLCVWYGFTGFKRSLCLLIIILQFTAGGSRLRFAYSFRSFDFFVAKLLGAHSLHSTLTVSHPPARLYRVWMSAPGGNV